MLVLGGAVIGVVLAITGDDDDEDDVAGPDTTTTTTAPLSDTAKELVDRLENARGLEFHVVMDQVDPTAEGAVRLEVWRRGDLIAQSLTSTATSSGEELVREVRSFQLSDGNVICAISPETPWECQRSTSVATEADDAAGIIDAVAANLGGKTVTAEDRTIGDHEAICYTIESSESTEELCLTEEGIPVALSSGGETVEVTTFERAVDDDAFEPPAPITEPTTSTTAG